MSKHLKTFENWMSLALSEGRKYLGATAPNPPVGAILLSSNGEILARGAHPKPGEPHAEIQAFNNVSPDRTDDIHTLVVTLEPCAHFGKTPPCLHAILDSPVKRVVIGTLDPNPLTHGKSIQMLRLNGIEVIESVLESQAKELIHGFSHWIETKTPWVTLKTAHLPNGSMIPPSGLKTFSSHASLTLAHELRKQSDAIITGSGTVLTDDPDFTVRHVDDHPEKVRWMIVMDRRKRICEAWKKKIKSHRFELVENLRLEEIKSFLGEKGCHHALIEAGPALAQAAIDLQICDEQVQISQIETQSGVSDRINRKRGSQCSLVS